MVVVVVITMMAALVIGVVSLLAKAEQEKIEAMTPDQRSEYLQRQRAAQEAAAKRHQAAVYGPCNPAMICPHCTQKGQVHVKQVKQKKGISGAKATGALLTGGVSVLATGLSRKEKNTQAHCGNCNSTWFF